MKWRIIPLETHDAFMNMAIDEAISETVASGESLPTIRFYRWKPSAVSIGYFQSLEGEVNVEECKARGIDVVRRRTGGGAVYHDHDNEITYSVILPESAMTLGITESYHEICGWIIKGLAQLGIEAEFKPINDVITGGKKISGNAQTRRGRVILQHGTILYGVDLHTMFTVLKVSAEKISDKMIAAAEERVTSVNRIKPELSYEDVLNALIASFIDGKETEEGILSEHEKKRAEELVKERYQSAAWNSLR